jgi:hypothetical protein
MPTAVEYFEAFLKLQGVNDSRLDDAFANIDGDFLKLATANTDTLAGIEHEVKIDFRAIGDPFHKLSTDFDRIATLGTNVDRLVVNLTTPSPNGGPATSAAVSSPQADFLAFDQGLEQMAMDYKILAADFVKIDSARTPDDFQARVQKVASDFYALEGESSDSKHKGDILAADVSALGGGHPNNPSPLDRAYQALAGELMTVAGDFGNLSTDFGLLLPAVQKAAGLPTSPNGEGGGDGGSLGGAFITLFQDFHALNADLGSIAPTAAAVVNDTVHQFFAGTQSHGGGGGAG